MPASTADGLETLNSNLRATLPNGCIVAQPLPDCGNITLGLIDPAYPTGPLPPDVMRAVVEQPAYWAFCWGSGLGLARMLFRHPEWVRGKSIVDLGTGSGVVAIAAARCGAARVVACDTDPLALAAARANAALNQAELEFATDLDAIDDAVELVLLADVLYDTANLPLVDRVVARHRNVLVADSRIRSLPGSQFRRMGEIDARTWPNLGEFDEFRTVRLFLTGRL
jgi:predicted nicotinamide N-methyase